MPDCPLVNCNSHGDGPFHSISNAHLVMVSVKTVWIVQGEYFLAFFEGFTNMQMDTMLECSKVCPNLQKCYMHKYEKIGSGNSTSV